MATTSAASEDGGASPEMDSHVMLSAHGEASTDGGDSRSPEEGVQRARDSGSASAGAMAAAQ